MLLAMASFSAILVGGLLVAVSAAPSDAEPVVDVCEPAVLAAERADILVPIFER